MLAYVFWHWSSPLVDVAAYRRELLAFHRSLAEHPSPGMAGSRAWAIPSVPWLPVPRAFEDWYLVEDYAALGRLNEAAVAHAHRERHDGVARLAAGGAGGLYRRLTEGAEPAEHVTWFAKPGGTTYAELLGRMPPSAELWQRQLVLGPAPEFCLALATGPAGVEGLALRIERVGP